MPKESRIQGQIIKWLKAQSGCIAENVSGNSKQSGRSDINACIRGRCVKIEVKRPDSSYDVTTKQKIYLRRWRRAGAIAISVETLQEVKDALAELLEE